MTNKELLKNAGFDEKNTNILERDLGNGFTITATISGADGVIFHLNKNGNLLQPTTQTVEPDDVAKAFTDLMDLIPLLVKIINTNTAHPENDFKQLIEFLQVLAKY